MTIICLRHPNASQLTFIHFTVKKINIRNIMVNKLKKNFSCPQIHRSTITVSLGEESHHSNLGADVCGDRLYILFFIVKQVVPPSQLWRTIYGCWWVNFLSERSSQRQKLWSQSSFDANPNDSSLWHLLKGMPDLLLTLIWTIRGVSFERKSQKNK